MSRVRIKICGITSPLALEAAVEAGVDAVGFVMSPSPRQLDHKRVAALLQLVPPWVTSVIVTRQPPVDFASEVLSVLRPGAWQSDRADIDSQQAPDGVKLIPVLREGEQHTTYPATFVYEGIDSGTGNTIDWQAAAQIAQQGRMVLAGGLDPDNVGEAIAMARPWGVDVSSGVESAPGKKDPALIEAFVAAVAAAPARSPAA